MTLNRLLLARPDSLAAQRGEPALLAPAVEEIECYGGSVQASSAGLRRDRL